MNSLLNNLSLWLNTNWGRIIFLIIVIGITALTARYVNKLIHMVYDYSGFTGVSLFVNISRVIIWLIAISIVLKPVFGINPSTLTTALGLGGVAVSLGLQDTMANIAGGFGLMAGKVVRPGDLVSIAGITGTVKDITWRHTIVTERNGTQLWIPNSVINKVSLEKLSEKAEAATKLHVILKSDVDTVKTVNRIIHIVSTATEGLSLAGSEPMVHLTNFTQFGIDAEITVFARPDINFVQIIDAAAQSLAGQDFLAHS